MAKHASSFINHQVVENLMSYAMEVIGNTPLFTVNVLAEFLYNFHFFIKAKS